MFVIKTYHNICYTIEQVRMSNYVYAHNDLAVAFNDRQLQEIISTLEEMKYSFIPALY